MTTTRVSIPSTARLTMIPTLKYRGHTRNVIAVDPNDIIYPKKISIHTNYMFIGWKKWTRVMYRDSTNVEFLPIELGRMMKYNIITREEHNTIINMLRSEDIESVYLAHRTIEGLKNKRHGRL